MRGQDEQKVMVADSGQPTLESQSQNDSQNCPRLSPKTLTYGVFDREFAFDSQEWVCSLVDLVER